jgi:hypothetical protein
MAKRKKPVRFWNCSYGAVVIGFFLEILFRWNKPGIPVIRFFIVFPILLNIFRTVTVRKYLIAQLFTSDLNMCPNSQIQL